MSKPPKLLNSSWRQSSPLLDIYSFWLLPGVVNFRQCADGEENDSQKYNTHWKRCHVTSKTTALWILKQVPNLKINSTENKPGEYLGLNKMEFKNGMEILFCVSSPFEIKTSYVKKIPMSGTSENFERSLKLYSIPRTILDVNINKIHKTSLD